MLTTCRPLLAEDVGLNSTIEKANPDDSTAAYWVTQLSHQHYLRRETAEKKLVDAGIEAVDELASVMSDGDLEAIERASSALTQIAVDHHPAKDGGAWQTLSDLSTSTAGLVAASTRRAADEIRRQRGQQALSKLRAAGVFVGVDEFMIRAVSQRTMVAQVDEKWNGDVAALEWFRWLDNVQTARLVGPAINKAVLERISKLPKLESIAMVDGTLGPGDLDPLIDRGTIRSLDIRYVKLSEDMAMKIASLRIRDSVTLMGTGTSDEVVDLMKAAAPGLLVENKKGGFLGVKCLDRAAECEITEVVVDSAAEAAGLIAGDVIVKVDDAVVEQFSDLQAEINQHFAGESMDLEYLRAGQLQKTKIKLRRLNR